MRGAAGLLAVVLLVCAAACASLPGDHAPMAAPRAWVTSADGASRLSPMSVGAWTQTQIRTPDLAQAPASDSVISVDDEQSYQIMQGFGAAITDSSAWLFQHSLNADQRAALMEELFGSEQGALGLDVVRVTIGASDFSRAHYSYRDDPDQFDLAAAQQDLIPTLREARAHNRELIVMGSPWSAPAWMKTSQSLVTGSLDAAHYDDFAIYLRDYLVAMRQSGVPIDILTIQNEPHFEPANYPGMRMSPQQRADFVGGHLGPLLEREGLDVEILEWDHNWDEPDAPLATLSDTRAHAYIDGVAWHCYAGDVAAQSIVHAAFPDKAVWMTECAGGAWDSEWGSVLAWMTRNLIIGTARHWAEGVILWNLALDEQSGPHLGGCGNCRGVITIDQATGAVTRNVEYYVLAHASRFVAPGARRIASETIASEMGASGLESVAFRNPDGSTALIVLNGADDARRFQVRAGDHAFAADLPAGAVATYLWGPPLD